MSEYGEVARSVTKAFDNTLFKYEQEALDAAMQVAKHYGLDDEVAKQFVEQIARDKRRTISAGGSSW